MAEIEDMVNQMFSQPIALGIDPEHFAPRSRKPGRGKAAATVALGRAAHDILASASSAMTLRQLYYALVSAEAIPKTTAAYEQLKRIVRDLREDGTIPWDWLVDHTRSVFQARTFDGIEGLLTDSARLYRRDLMRQQDVAIQVWAESDSIGSVIAPIADRYTIPTFIGRGYSARGYLWAAATDAVRAHRMLKTVAILHVGDFDPSGVDIFRDLEETLRLYAIAFDWAWSVDRTRRYIFDEIRRAGLTPERRWRHTGTSEWHEALADETEWLEFDRLALLPAQVEEHRLPTRPPKTSDVRTAKFAGVGTVEVEALPVDVLLEIVEGAIRSRIDSDALATVEIAEQSEREIAMRIAGTPVERLIEAAS